MAFIDNSGDIILDAVLTDEGRRRLAMGDGSFRITKFALGDDEIDYSLYDKTPANGTGYEDTRILQLPVFEAFTNNTTSLKNRVTSLIRVRIHICHCNFFSRKLFVPRAVKIKTEVFAHIVRQNEVIGQLVLVEVVNHVPEEVLHAGTFP